MPYNVAALKSLVSHNKTVEIDVFSWGIKKKLTPYVPPKIERVHYHDESDFNFGQLLSLYDSFNYEIIYVCNRREKKYLKLALYARRKGTIVIGQSDEQFYGTFRQYIKKALSYFLYIRYFDYMMVPGYYQYEFMRFLGFKKEVILIGAYTADTSLFGEFYLNNKKNINQEIRLSKKRMLYLGRLECEKGLDLLCYALEDLKGMFDIELIVVGNGSMKDLITSYSFVQHHSFMEQEEILRILMDVDYFVLPSVYEPWGVVLHEMAAAGMVIISSDACGANSFFVFNNYNGFVFKRGSLNSLKVSLERAFSLDSQKLKDFKYRSNELSKSISPSLWAETINGFLR
jgi:glycosyltransferase involved in cell wall biosynthesis